MKCAQKNNFVICSEKQPKMQVMVLQEYQIILYDECAERANSTLRIVYLIKRLIQ